MGAWTLADWLVRIAFVVVWAMTFNALITFAEVYV